MSTPIILPAFAVEAELKAEFPNACVQVSDKDYQVMADASVSGWAWRFFTWVLTFFKIPRRADNAHLPKWLRKFQCEDFSVVYIAIVLLIHARAWASSAEGVYVGLIFHKARSGVGHVVLFKRNRKGIVAFEPQTREFYQFTREEKASAWLVVLF